MPSLFTRIIQGEIPGRFVWRDDEVVAFLTIAPLAPGHVLVVPIQEIDHWIDLPPALAVRVWRVAQAIGRVLQEEFQPVKVGVLVVGEEINHAHVHLVPFNSVAELNFANADPNPDPAALDDVAERIRAGLREDGHEGSVPDE
jgi:histidine triad (HIT) family protein